MNYKNIEVFYEDQGQGNVVVLLHGFLENSTMWDYLISELSPSYRLITVDLLGHGKTGNLGYVHTMAEMAELVLKVLEHLNIEEFVVIGHSMGGYVALALAKRNQHRLKGICLMNSTYRSDNDGRKSIRKKAIEMVRMNYDLIVRTSVSNLFAAESKSKFPRAIEMAIDQALQTPVQGYVAAQRGMMEREDLYDFLKHLKTEKLIIVGAKDPIIDYQRILSETLGTTINYKELTLGHMSHIENKSENTYIIMQFIENIYA